MFSGGFLGVPKQFPVLEGVGSNILSKGQGLSLRHTHTEPEGSQKSCAHLLPATLIHCVCVCVCVCVFVFVPNPIAVPSVGGGKGVGWNCHPTRFPVLVFSGSSPHQMAIP